jgi:hypothetical protein
MDKVMLELYREVYKAATPSANFDELYENAPTNEIGERVIDFDSYVVENEVLDKIFEDTMKKFKVPKWRYNAYRVHYYLGATPRSKPAKNSSPINTKK